MIVFNRHIVFQNEETLQTHISHDSLETINVAEEKEYSLQKNFLLKSGWYPMSGREMRYYSSKPFEEAGRIFSWALEIKDTMTLVWDADQRNILYTKKKEYTPQILKFWVLHTFIPLILELERSYHFLHVGSVEVADKAVLFSAFSYGGKSTLTDYFMQNGHAMLTDDSIAIESRGDTYFAVSSYPFHRPFREIETLGYPVVNFVTDPKPIHAVYLLEKSEPDVAIEVTELKGIEKFKAFYYSSFIDFDFMKQERFGFFAEMAKNVAIYKITIPWNIERLDEVYHTIVDRIDPPDMV
ncbi:MAG: hypothetical protein P794_05440 [Epsilonproteobacteria bacterium (ex Lamellibrachia satsuma)]|nr:MAG: hypothetical protein P794_05440 [Epsilonproteobacteria bacterium (ex Lamellibrachia satsuma)]